MNQVISPRSVELCSPADSGLLVVDVQEKLVGLIRDHRRLVWNVARLIDGASALGVFTAASEQYPKGLGPTVPELGKSLGAIPAKRMFSCRESGVFGEFHGRGVHRLLIAGIETHVCVLQTALDAMADGFRVYLAVDAVGSRLPVDHETALRRLESSGATLTTTETALFEWCETSTQPQFKAISQLVRQSPPD